jgi:hypothetical protein
VPVEVGGRLHIVVISSPQVSAPGSFTKAAQDDPEASSDVDREASGAVGLAFALREITRAIVPGSAAVWG